MILILFEFNFFAWYQTDSLTILEVICLVLVLFFAKALHFPSREEFHVIHELYIPVVIHRLQVDLIFVMKSIHTSASSSSLPICRINKLKFDVLRVMDFELLARHIL